MDIFEEYLIKYKQDKNCRALTCKSYKKVYQKNNGVALADKKTNFELATYGDALLKVALCHIFFDCNESLSESKKPYEEDKYLVVKVASNYELIKYMNFDRDDKAIPQNYEYIKKGNDNDNAHKYIATTVEAVLGALFKDEGKSFEEICSLVESWTKLN